MWNFLFLLVSKDEEEERGGGGFCWSGLFSKYCDPFARPVLNVHPPQPDPDSTGHEFVVPFAKWWRSKSVHSLLFICTVCKQPGAEAFDICGHINQGCLPGKPSPHPHWMPPLSLTSASAVLQAPLTWQCATSSGSNAVAQMVFPVKRKGRLMFVWAERSRFPDRDPHHIHNNLAVKHAACCQPPGLWSDGPHDSEEESRIREKEWEEERRRRVIYRVKEYRIQMCNKMRWGGCWSMWPLMALDHLGLPECVTPRAWVWMLSSAIRFNSGTH